MNIKMNNYMNQISYTAIADERASKPNGDGKTESEVKTASNKDTISISVEGQLFVAELVESDSEMGLLRITSDLDSFRSALKSVNEPLPVDWEKVVDLIVDRNTTHYSPKFRVVFLCFNTLVTNQVNECQ